jgi:hypothetical protein
MIAATGVDLRARNSALDSFSRLYLLGLVAAAIASMWIVIRIEIRCRQARSRREGALPASALLKANRAFGLQHFPAAAIHVPPHVERQLSFDSHRLSQVCRTLPTVVVAAPDISQRRLVAAD